MGLNSARLKCYSKAPESESKDLRGSQSGGSTLTNALCAPHSSGNARGSVSRVLSLWVLRQIERSFIWNGRYRTFLATNPNGRCNADARPYLVLLRMGFTLRKPLPAFRCALTAPFQLFPFKRGSLLSVALSLESPPPAINRHPVTVEPGLSSNIAIRDCPTLWRVAFRPNKDLWQLPNEGANTL